MIFFNYYCSVCSSGDFERGGLVLVVELPYLSLGQTIQGTHGREEGRQIEGKVSHICGGI